MSSSLDIDFGPPAYDPTRTALFFATIAPLDAPDAENWHDSPRGMQVVRWVGVHLPTGEFKEWRLKPASYACALADAPPGSSQHGVMQAALARWGDDARLPAEVAPEVTDLVWGYAVRAPGGYRQREYLDRLYSDADLDRPPFRLWSISRDQHRGYMADWHRRNQAPRP